MGRSSIARVEPNIIDRVITMISPEMGLRRQHARSALALSGGYTGARYDRRETRDWFTRPTSADESSIPDLPTLRARSRDLVRNAPIAALFNAWVDMIRAMDYRVEWRVLNCADYGAPTTRRRLFMICRKGGRKIVWPEATHVPAASLKKRGQAALFEETRKPWRTAREIIDWQRQSHCIFDRKRPLAPNTQRRIQAGLRKFSGIELNIAKCYEEGLRPYLLVPPGGTVKEAQAFLLPHRGKDPNQSIEDPFRTVTATSSDFALVEPFLMTIDQTGGTSACVRSADDPLPTLVTKANAAVCEPFLIGQQSDAAPRHSAEPVPTVATAGSISLTEPHIIPQFGTASAASVDKPLGVVTTTSRGVGLTEPFLAVLRGTSSTSDIDNPVPTVTNSGAHYAAVEPFMVPNFGEREGQQPRTHSVDAPVPAVTGHGAGAVVEPFIATVTHSGGDRVRSIDLPLATVTRSMGDGVAAPALVSYYGATQNMSSVDEPTPTVTTKDRFGLMQPQVVYEQLLAEGWTMFRLEVRFRMLQPRELARAQGFDDAYQFVGNREAVVKQIGNAVPPPMARALCAEVLQ